MGDSAGAANLHGLIAILRGLTPDAVEPVVGALLEEGFRAIEIPLNSPQPFVSLERAVRLAQSHAPGVCHIGAGTVLTGADVARVHDCGGNLIVSPNTDPAVIGETLSRAMISMPGVFSPTEAHLAISSRATALKFFPAFKLGADGIAAIRATLPPEMPLYAVGGVDAGDFAAYRAAGIAGFGLGSNLFKPGMEHDEIRKRAARMIAHFQTQTRAGGRAG